MSILRKIKKMKDPEGFEELWLEKVKDGASYQQAYYELEEEYAKLVEKMGLESILDNRRYASYDSFRISKNKRNDRDQSVKECN